MRLSNIHMKSLGEEVGGEGILQLWVFEADEGDEGLLTKDIVQVSLVPYIFIGEVLSEVAIALADRHEIEGHLLVLYRRKGAQIGAHLIEKLEEV